jgi:hypothetical protein
MQLEELNLKLEDIRKNMRWIDTMIYTDKSGGSVTEEQVVIFRNILDLFKELNWKVAVNLSKDVVNSGTSPLDMKKCGTPVKVRPCAEEYGGKTFFGVLLGDIALAITHSVENEVVTATHSFYNPAIYIPELGKIIFGMESWWGKIETKEDLDEITDETIRNVWYVKLLTTAP